MQRHRYDAFGKPTIYKYLNGEFVGIVAETAINNRFLFTGREYQSRFGFYEYRARAYQPTLGRFMSEDPKGFDAGDYNMFRYCHNDPLDLTDPMGLSSMEQFEQNVAAQAKVEVTGSNIKVTAANVVAAKQLLGQSTAHTLAAQSSAEGVAQMQQRRAAPDKSQYAAGEPYSAERSLRNNYDYPAPQPNANGNIVRTADIDIWVFDRDHKAINGIAVTEPKGSVEQLNPRDFRGDLHERSGFTAKTLRNGQLEKPDTWQHVFSSREGSVVRRQTLISGGNKLRWDGTHSAKWGAEIYGTQKAYFVRPGSEGY